MPNKQPERDAIASVLPKARAARGLSQASLALLIGVSKATVAMWELAKAAPLPETEPALLRVLGVTASQLRGWEPLPELTTHRREQRRRWT